MKPGRAILLMMAVVIAIGLMGIGYSWSSTTSGTHTVSMGNLGMGFTDVTCGDPAGTLDLGAVPPKDVGWTECALVDTDDDGDFDVLEITVHNAYPGYQVMVQGITITNLGTIPIYITGAELVQNDDPVAVALEGFWTETNLVCELLEPGGTLLGELWLYLAVTQPALQGHTYTFQVDITGEQWNQVCTPTNLGGTPGFWKNWDSHNTYTEAQIVGWLDAINTASAWLGPTTTGGMESWLDFSNKSPMEDKFLGHYLATRLDAEAGRLGLSTSHDVTGLDPANYLGLATPSSASLSEIVAAIEDKHGTSPDNDEFEVMKDICDALNNLEI